MTPYLIPFNRVGDFVLGDNIKNLLINFPFKITDFSHDEIAPSINYSVNNPKITLYVSNGKIDFIGCYEELLYNGINLIGITIEVFSSILDTTYTEVDLVDFEADELPQYIYEFESVGLQVWVKGNKGKVISIMVNSKEHYLD